jgi:hypothetical protein
MLSVVLRMQAYQEHHMDLFKAVRAKPDDTGLHAQFDQAMQELVVVAAELQALEAMGLWCPGAAAASAVVS